MQLNYTITQEHYEDVIAFQLKLQRSKRRSLIQYIVTNAIFIILAVYFLVTHPESSAWSLLTIFIMALNIHNPRLMMRLHQGNH